MTHHCVSLFLNIFSLHCCVFILSEWGRCYGLHTTFVYGSFNQDQIMESCLHPWAHPQKLRVCVFPRFHDTPECSNTYFSQQIISTQTRNRIKVCVCIVHEASWGDLPVFYVISPSLDYVSWFTVTSGSVIAMATLLSLIFTPDFNQAVWCITLFVFICKFPPGAGTDCAENGTNLIHIKTRALNKARLVLSDPSHPLAPEFKLLPSRCKFNVPRCRTDRLKKSWVPVAIGLLNNS